MIKNIFLLLTLTLFFVGQIAVAETSQAQIFSGERSLKLGMSGQDVYLLQKFLNSDVDTQISLSGVGSPGMETQYFGLMTEIAVKKFQNKYRDEILTPNGLYIATGFVGPATINAIQKISGGKNSIQATALPNNFEKPLERDPNLVIFSFVPYELAPDSPILIVLNASSTDFDVYVNDKLLKKNKYETKDKQYILIEDKVIKDKAFTIYLKRGDKISNKLDYVVNSKTGVNIFENNYYKTK